MSNYRKWVKTWSNLGFTLNMNEPILTLYLKVDSGWAGLSHAVKIQCRQKEEASLTRNRRKRKSNVTEAKDNEK